SFEHWEEQYEVVEGVLAELHFNPKGRLVVFNKVDRLTHVEQAAIEQRAAALLDAHVFSSTVEAAGLESLRTRLRETIRRRWSIVTLTIPASAGGVLAEIYREGEVLTREEGGTSIRSADGSAACRCSGSSAGARRRSHRGTGGLIAWTCTGSSVPVGWVSR
ncbi:MAG: hypothetical protein GTO46_03280, partial [Gemmatimonadetes bacterium]|nr:hypothetical protein [Gemmatimonadota bacterium]NIO30806.1 hypothetical protein [Gemmatimonadota bacterium]